MGTCFSSSSSLTKRWVLYYCSQIEFTPPSLLKPLCKHTLLSGARGRGSQRWKLRRELGAPEEKQLLAGGALFCSWCFPCPGNAFSAPMGWGTSWPPPHASFTKGPYPELLLKHQTSTNWSLTLPSQSSYSGAPRIPVPLSPLVSSLLKVRNASNARLHTSRINWPTIIKHTRSSNNTHFLLEMPNQ